MEQVQKILLVDDDNLSNFLSDKFLRMYFTNAEIVSTLAAEEALDYLSDCLKTNSQLPNIIFLDINMPLMDGWDFLNRFEEMHKINTNLNAVNIIMYTSSLYVNDIKKGKEHPFVKDVFTKPLDESKVKILMQLL